MMPMQLRISRTTANSSCLLSFGYAPSVQVLEVEFPGGRVYRYFDVSSGIYQGLVEAPSKGRYFHRFIRKLSFAEYKPS